MQFTVIIEFLMPGLAALLLGLALLPGGALPPPPSGAPTGETATALLLLAVSYPVGHLVNFPIYVLVQQKLLAPLARRRAFREFSKKGIDLAKLATRQLELQGALPFSGSTQAEARRLFHYMRAVVFCKNIERLNSDHLYHQGLQRLARGMFVPILMAGLLVERQGRPGWLSLVVVLVVFFLVCLALLVHSVRREEEQIATFFTALTSGEGRPTPALKPTADAAAQRI